MKIPAELVYKKITGKIQYHDVTKFGGHQMLHRERWNSEC